MIDLISEKIDGIPVIRISGRIDMETASELEQNCGKFIDQGERSLVLDFTGVRFISSWGLRSILTIGKKLAKTGGQLVTCGQNPTVKEVFQISGFDSAFPAFPTLPAAVASFRR